ncbi:MAG: xanthine dehydrogenase family protein molybdopterin-binding subunit, partial [Candidatus Bathyarchaeia archaeon]
MSYNVVGRSVPRIDGLNKVLGRACFIDDMEFPNMLYAKLLRSKHAHARILKVDTSRAEATRGVRGVLTSRDVPVNFHCISFKDQPLLASDKVRYLGDPVACVAAESEDVAEEALALIDVQYEPLPAVFDAHEAMKPDAPRVHDRPNLYFHRKIRFGDVEKGFEESDSTFEDEFSTQRIEQCHIEPHGAIGSVDASGRVTVWTPAQSLPLVHSQLARVLGLPTSAVRILQTTLGGGFGGKTDLSVEPYVALLAMKTRRPVKMTWTREEEFTGSTIRHNYVMKYKTGVKRDGTIVAREVELIADTGAYTSYGDVQLTKASIFARGPYNIPNVKVDAYLVASNNLVAGAMRGFGVVQVTAAEETHTDNIAERLEIDPLELRLKNALKTGDQLATGQILHSVGLVETLVKAGQTSGWGLSAPSATDPRKRRGRGLACFQYPIGFTAQPNPSGAFLKVNNDGTVNVIPGARE